MMITNKTLFDTVNKRINSVLDSKLKNVEKLESICEILRENFENFEWVGFYLIDPERENTLILGPFSGETTTLVKIRYGEGILGQVAKNEKTMVIHDMSKEVKYLVRNSNVKSEIVIPVFKNNMFAGGLKIDSYAKFSFTKDIKEFLKDIRDIISPLF